MIIFMPMAITLAAVGNGSILKTRAISTIHDTSIRVISDAATYDTDSGIGLPWGDLDTRPAAFWLKAHSDHTNKSGLIPSWQAENESLYDVAIFDIMGKKARTLYRETMPIGFHD